MTGKEELEILTYNFINLYKWFQLMLYGDNTNETLDR